MTPYRGIRVMTPYRGIRDDWQDFVVTSTSEIVGTTSEIVDPAEEISH
jgi:hypothetical protein